MKILGIGPLELLFIILLALIILGPKDLQKTGKSIGQGLSKLVKSDTWKTVQRASEKVKSLPNELMREAGMEDMKKSLDSEIIQPVKHVQESLDGWASESWVPESASSDKYPVEGSSGDTNRTAPADPNEEHIK